MGEKLSLRWGSHQDTVLHSLENSFGAQDFVDLTLACEGQSVQAHRVIVSACSSFLKKLLQDHPCPHPIVILKDIKMSQLKQLLEFMYCGQVIVEQRQLDSLLHAAQVLGVRGLTDVDCSESPESLTNHTPTQENLNSSNVVLSCNNSILASYLSAPPLSKLPSTTPVETEIEDVENNKSLANTASEIDFVVKPEEVDLGEETEFQNTDAFADVNDTLNLGSQSVGKATAFMLTLAKRANREAAIPYSTHSEQNSPFTKAKQCLLCTECFYDDASMRIHMRNVHKSKHQRPTSTESSDGEASADHKLAFYEARPCSVCRKMYRDAASLRTHMNIMHTPWRDGFECSCKQVFLTKYEMYQHRKSHGKSERAYS